MNRPAGPGSAAARRPFSLLAYIVREIRRGDEEGGASLAGMHPPPHECGFIKSSTSGGERSISTNRRVHTNTHRHPQAAGKQTRPCTFEARECPRVGRQGPQRTPAAAAELRPREGLHEEAPQDGVMMRRGIPRHSSGLHPRFPHSCTQTHSHGANKTEGKVFSTRWAPQKKRPVIGYLSGRQAG